MFKRYEMRWFSEKTFSDFQNLGHHDFSPDFFSRIFFYHDFVPEPEDQEDQEEIDILFIDFLKYWDLFL